MNNKIPVYLKPSVSRAVIYFTDIPFADACELKLTPAEIIEYVAARAVVARYQERFRYKRRHGYDKYW